MVQIGRPALIGLLLGFITLGLFWPVIGFDFINFDDPVNITDNTAIHAGLTKAGVAWAWTTTHNGYWQPLTWVSHMLDCSLYGPKPGGHHLTNLLFHVANVVLLFLVLRQLTGAVWRSASVAVLFGCHPLHVESVAWVSERKDVLSTFFWLLTIGAYAYYVRASKGVGPRPPGFRFKVWYAVALLCFALGLMSKPMVVTLPFVLLLLDYWPLGRMSAPVERGARRMLWMQLVLDKIPFLILAATICLGTFRSAESHQAVVSLEHLPGSARVANALTSYVLYVWKMLWPKNLAVYYPYPNEWTSWVVAADGLLLLLITAAVIWRARARPYLAIGWFWFVGTLVPVIGLVQSGTQRMADRFTYVPLIGVFVMLAWGIPDLLAKRRRICPALATGAAAVLIIMMFSTRAQLHHWRNSMTLFSHAVEATRDNIVAEYCLARALNRQNEEQAIVHYLNATGIRPGWAETYANPQYLAHCSLGTIFSRRQKWPEAEAHFRAAIRSNPDCLPAHGGLGDVLLARGRVAEAGDEYRTTTRLQPGNPEGWRRLGAALVKQGKSDEALQAYREAVRLNPDGAAAVNDLGWFLATDPHAELRNAAEAIRLAQQACELTDRREARFMATLDAAYAEAGRFAEAIAVARQVQAVALAQGQGDQATAAQKRLELYREGKPYRER